MYGTFWIVYDYMKYFDRETASHIERSSFLEIINDIFKSFSPLEREAIIYQYTDWEALDDGFKNQKAVADVVGDYFFICPSNLFANLYAEHCDKVFYYFFNHVSTDRIKTFLLSKE
ncbi:hypothetical protein SK128_019788 [Halocaridina rubra]|uniref:Carboxylesterase type B domain-containing protein n=1 Tax=Halocaridina rubra TaxID=373956 RepID=A0AAN8WM52_HALRR